jgi:hypothetical protein
MYIKPVPITAFVNPTLRHQIKVLAAMQGITVRQLITAELERIAQIAQTKYGKPRETN